MSENVGTEIEVVEAQDAQAIVAGLAHGQTDVWSSMSAATQTERLALYSAITSAENVRDHLNETINLSHVIAQAIKVRDRGDSLVDAVRIILIDDEGRAFASVADGLVRAVKNIIGIVGEPNTWDSPIPVKVVEVEGRNRGQKFFTLVPVLP